jgi:rhamnulokinase
MRSHNDSALEAAHKILFIPDALMYMLTGESVCEYTILSTSQMLDPRTKRIDPELIEAIGLKEEQFGRYVKPCDTVGTLSPEVQRLTGLGAVPVVAVAGHDTASAVAAVPAQEGSSFAYISSGTWSLFGAETTTPLRSVEVMEANYTNEGGIGGTTRLLKNIMGLWMIQECKREWDRRSDAVDFAGLVEMAIGAPAFKAIIDVDDPCFLAPGDMPARIQAYCERTGQAVPKGRGEISRVIYEGLALRYRWAIERLEQDMLKKPVKVLHIVGGGSKNALLNRFTAEALKRPVVAGPGEGTVIGNLLMQAKALGAIEDIPGLRRVVEASFPTKTFAPETDGRTWDAAYAEYVKRFG